MVLTLLIAFFSLIVLMIIHEFGHFIIAKKFGIKVEEFGIGYPPRIFGKKFGETLYSINLLPLGAFVRIKGEEGGIENYRSFIGLAMWKRVLIVLGGIIAFWLAAIILFSIVFSIGTDIPIGDQDIPGLTNARVKILIVGKGSPAESAGLRIGDTIVKVRSTESEVKINKIKDFQDFTKENLGQQITLTIDRGGKVFALFLTPRLSPPQNQGPVGVVLERMATLIEKYPWYQTPARATIYCAEITMKAVQGLFDVVKSLFSGRGVPEGAEMAGPLGITVFLARAIDYGTGFFLYFIGIISVFVALFNLFPIPALDGGKLLFLAIEKVRKKPVSAKIERNITAIFFFLLIALSIFVTIRFDIPRLSDFLKSSLER